MNFVQKVSTLLIGLLLSICSTYAVVTSTSESDRFNTTNLTTTETRTIRSTSDTSTTGSSTTLQTTSSDSGKNTSTPTSIEPQESTSINSTSATNTGIFGNKNAAIVTLDDLGNSQDINIVNSDVDKNGIQKLLLRIADSIKRIFYILASMYFIIIAIKLIVASNTEEELENFKKGIIWITIGLIVMNLAVYLVNVIYSPYNVNDTNATNFDLSNIAENLLTNLINPIIKLLETATAFIFLLIAIFAFFRLVSANGDEEKAKKGKMTIVYAIVGFIVVVIAAELVFAVYGSCDGSYSQVAAILGAECQRNTDLSATVAIIINVIKWLNSFVAVIVILMIIYAGIQILFSGGEEEKVSNAKKSIVYIVIGILILVTNYLIITFFF